MNTEDRVLDTSETSQLIASNKVEGTKVYSRSGEHLGEVSHFMVDKRTGRVPYAVMSFGGFLGIGEHHHPLPWEALDYDERQGGYVVDLDKDKLEGAPRYEPHEDPWVDPMYPRGVSGYWGYPFII